MKIDARTLAAANAAELVMKQEQLCESLGVPFDYRLTGMEVLGMGAFGAALLMPDGNVLKICRKAHDAYPLYALWASRNQGPGIPEIYWAHRVSPTLFFAAMPRYNRLCGDDENRIIRLRDAGLAGNGPGYLSKAVERVNAAPGGMANRDMHTGNFLYCPNTGEYKITDPFASLDLDQAEAEATVTGRKVGTAAPQIAEQMPLAGFGNVLCTLIYSYKNMPVPPGLAAQLEQIEAGEYKLRKNTVLLYADHDGDWGQDDEYRPGIEGHDPNEYAGWNFFVKVEQFNK